LAIFEVGDPEPDVSLHRFAFSALNGAVSLISGSFDLLLNALDENVSLFKVQAVPRVLVS